jgi:hypothetical protein
VKNTSRDLLHDGDSPESTKGVNGKWLMVNSKWLMANLGQSPSDFHDYL